MKDNTRGAHHKWLIPGVLGLIALAGGIMLLRTNIVDETPAPQVLTATESEPPMDDKTEQIATLSIVTPNGREDYEIVTLEEITVAELLAQAEKEHDLTVNTTEASFGVYVESINDIPSEGGQGGYWLFSINGASSPVGISEAIVNPGDIVEWTYEQ